MSAERDAGLAAMQSGDIETAIQQLELATQQNPNDYQASMYLGAAYGQAKRHTDAVTILTTAVQIEPANAQARYNLGIAMEQGGWVEQAKQAYEQALTLQPDYAKAQEALGRTQAMLAAQQPTVDPMNMPTTVITPQGYAPHPTLEKQTQQPLYAPPAQQGYGQQSAPLPYGTPPPAPYPQQVAMYPAQSQYREDTFSIKDALRDWKEVLFSPRTFWQRQADSDGLAAPSAMILTYVGVALIIGIALGVLFIGLREPIAIPIILIGGVIYALLILSAMFVMNFVMAGIFHLVGKMFGNRGTYTGSFRASVYAQAPGMLALVLSLILIIPFSGTIVDQMKSEFSSASSTTRSSSSTNPFGAPNAPGQSNFGNGGLSNSSRSASYEPPMMFTVMSLIGNLFSLVAFFWGLVLLGMGIAHIQKISTGGAVGTVILGYLIPIALIVFIIFMLFAGLMASAGGMR